MTAHKCDYCRGPLGLIAPRYWGMRFCSKAHKKAYQRRLAEETRAKPFGISPTSPTAAKCSGLPVRTAVQELLIRVSFDPVGFAIFATLRERGFAPRSTMSISFPRVLLSGEYPRWARASA